MAVKTDANDITLLVTFRYCLFCLSYQNTLKINLIIVCSVNKIHNMSEKIRSQISHNVPESATVFLVNFTNISNCGANDRDND